MDNVTTVASPFDSAYFIFTFAMAIVSGVVFLGGIVIALAGWHYHNSAWEMDFRVIEPKGYALGSKLKLEPGPYSICIMLRCRNTTVLSKDNTTIAIGPKVSLITEAKSSVPRRLANKDLVKASSIKWIFYRGPSSTSLSHPLEIKSITRTTKDGKDDIPFAGAKNIGGSTWRLEYQGENKVGRNHVIDIYATVVAHRKWEGKIEFTSDIGDNLEKQSVSRMVKIE